MFDLLLEHRRGGVLGLFDRFKAAAFRRSGVQAVVWGLTDAETFAQGHGLPIDRLRFHPYHTTLDGFDLAETDEGFIFSGGNNGRDFRTVIEALREIDYPVFIATTNSDVPALARSVGHIEVRGVTPEEFRQKLAACTLVVEAHPVDFCRTAGHQTMLNAMSLGKPLVIADRRSAAGYFEHGVEGLVTDAGDPAGLRSAVRELLGDPDRRRRMGEAGRRRLRDPLYRTPVHMQSIYNHALRLEYTRRGIAPGPLIESYGPANEVVQA